jgi:hypothetical protein
MSEAYAGEEPALAQGMREKSHTTIKEFRLPGAK